MGCCCGKERTLGMRSGVWTSRKVRFLAVGQSVAVHVVMIATVILVVLPMAWMLSTSLKPSEEVYAFPPNWIPRQFRPENFVAAWRSFPVARYALNSTIVVLVVVTSQLITGALAAYVFSQLRFPGRDAIFVAYLATMMVPGQVTVVPVFIVLKTLRWIDTYVGLTAPFLASAFGIFLIRQSFLSIPIDLIDAARIDGAGHLRILQRVLLPLSKAALVTFTLLSFTWRWNDYFWPLIVTNSTLMRTLPVGIVLLRATEGSMEWNVVMAGTVMVIAPVMLVFLFAQRQFVQGIAQTGLKG